MNREDLLKLIEDDDLGLLSVKPTNGTAITPEERLISSFLEIVNFVKENNREPNSENGLLEHQLASRLKSIREDETKIESLRDYDECNLLPLEIKKLSSINDVFEDDDFKILDNSETKIFNITNIKKIKSRDLADFIAHRKVCKNFDEYEPLFVECQKELSEGKRRLIPFKSDKQIKERSFFVLSGILLFIDKIGKTHIDKYGKVDGRQRCVFENGTESNMLFRSLVKRLYENGKAVTENLDKISEQVINNFNDITDKDKKTGFIYILKSLSTNPKIQSIDNLYKIGYSTVPVEERVKNASSEPAYLMAPVKIVTTYDCYNFNPQKLEQLLHNFFGSSCLNIDIFDNNNARYMPREWFIAPLDVIERAASMVISGEIVNYRYNSDLQEIAFSA